MIVWILVTRWDTAGEHWYWEKRYLDITQGKISQPTAAELRR